MSCTRWARRSSIGLMSRPFPVAFWFTIPGCEAALCRPNWETAAFHAGVQLVRQDIGSLVFWNSMSVPVVAAERGCNGAGDSSRRQSPGRVVVLKDDLSSPSVAHSLESAFGMRERPTAFVLTRALQVLTTSRGWLARDSSASGSLMSLWLTTVGSRNSNRRSLTTARMPQ